MVEAYEHLGIELYKPYLRAQMENDMKLIAQGGKTKDVVLRECIQEMHRIFHRVQENLGKMREFLVERMRQTGGRQPQIAAHAGSSPGDYPGGGGGGAEMEKRPPAASQNMPQGDTEFS